mmetsp:Transcript_21524/g.67255  ORF Transcript_21524/g.67255 Transcript_21524/m.67255 type:complete len:344 (-) Transcript_21524:225-1256(-)
MPWRIRQKGPPPRLRWSASTGGASLPCAWRRELTIGALVWKAPWEAERRRSSPRLSSSALTGSAPPCATSSRRWQAAAPSPCASGRARRRACATKCSRCLPSFRSPPGPQSEPSLPWPTRCAGNPPCRAPSRRGSCPCARTRWAARPTSSPVRITPSGTRRMHPQWPPSSRTTSRTSRSTRRPLARKSSPASRHRAADASHDPSTAQTRRTCRREAVGAPPSSPATPCTLSPRTSGKVSTRASRTSASLPRSLMHTRCASARATMPTRPQTRRPRGWRQPRRSTLASESPRHQRSRGSCSWAIPSSMGRSASCPSPGRRSGQSTCSPASSSPRCSVAYSTRRS